MTNIVAMPNPDDQTPAGERHDLPSGGWVVLRDPTKVMARDRKMCTMACTNYTGDVPLTGDDLTIAILVADWSFGPPLPSEDVGAAGRLVCADYDRLVQLVLPGSRLVFPTFEVAKNPESPTPPSAA